MRASDFDYDLPDHLIAQTPCEKRDHSRMMVVDRHSYRHSHRHFHRHFYDIVSYLKPGDVLVLNDTQVFHARLMLRRATGASVEVFLISPLEKPGFWTCLMKPAKRVKEGEALFLGELVVLTVVQKQVSDGLHVVAFNLDLYQRDRGSTCVSATARATDQGADSVHSTDSADSAHKASFWDILAGIGQIPLPPYIAPNSDLADRYDTVYAKSKGSVAAPTAGLHFTTELLDQIRDMGVAIESITLHVGLGTFKPIEADALSDHTMHSESVFIAPSTASRLTAAKAAQRPIIAVGTTVTRALEAAFSDGRFRDGAFDTDIFIYPGYSFGAIDGLITNFHLPRSTLLCLVSALIGREPLLAAYREAVAQSYRFYSFGDAMFIPPRGRCD